MAIPCDEKGAPVKPKKIPGSEYIFNRLNKSFEKMYDGVPYIFEPHEVRLMPEPVARWFWGKSGISYEPLTGVEERALVIPEDETWGIPYEKAIGPEYLDRSMSDSVVVDGLRLKPGLVTVKGGGYDKGKKIEKPERI